MKFLRFLFFLLISLPCLADSYGLADNIGRTARETTDLTALVQQLTHPLSRDADKARVIYAWIIYHIDYDHYQYSIIEEKNGAKARQIKNLSEKDIYKTRTGVCSDIAKLYQEMAQKAGLPCKVVTGYAGPGVTFTNKNEKRHAWNVVKIDGKWQFIDATWGIKGKDNFGKDLQSAIQYRSAILKKKNQRKQAYSKEERHVDEKWFFTNPEEMIKTHFPEDEKWQLLKPTKTFSWFVKNQAR